MAKKQLRRILKGVIGVLLIVLLLFVVLWGLLQFQPVQNWAVKQITNSLSNKLNTKVEIDRVDLKFFKTAQIQGIYAADLNGDTLLYARELDVDIGLFSFFQKNIYLNTIGLDEAYIHIYNQPEDSVFNFQFILDAFSPSDENIVIADSTGKSWIFDLGSFDIKRSRIVFHDQFSGTLIDAKIGMLEADIESLNFDRLGFYFDQLILSDSDIRIQSLTVDQPIDESIAGFPNIGLILGAKKLLIEGSNFSLHSNGDPPLQNQLDPSHLEFEKLNLEIEDFSWIENDLSFHLLNAEGFERKGFELNKLSAKFHLTPNEMSLNGLSLKTPTSEFDGSFSMGFNSFADLGDFENKVRLAMNANKGELSYTDIKFLVPQLLQTSIDLSANRHISVKGNLNGSISNLRTDGLQLKIGNQFDASLSGSISGLPDLNRFQANLVFKNLSTSYDHLLALTNGITLPEGIRDWGEMKLKGSLKGDLKKLVGKNFRILTEGKTRFEGDFTLENIADKENFAFITKVLYLTTTADEIRGFTKAEIPSAIDSLGIFSLKGNFQGTSYNFALDGKLQSEAGEVDTDLAIDFTKDYKNATYKGHITMDDFQLGKVLGDQTNVGLLSLDIEADGAGLTLDDIQANLKGNVRSIMIKNYLYKDFFVDGRMKGRKFLGIASIKDENIAFDFDGQVDLSGPEPDFIFDAMLDTINLHALNLLDDSLSLSGRIQANFIGGDVDVMEGFVHLTDAKMTNQNGTYETDRMSVFSNVIGPIEREFKLTSDIANVYVNGDFKLKELPEVMFKYVDNYFSLHHLIPSMNYVDSLSLVNLKSEYQKFSFEISISNPIPLTSLYLPTLTKLDTATILGEIDTKSQSMKLNGSIPGLTYSGMEIDSIQLLSNGDPNKITSNLSFKNIDISPSLQIPEAIGSFEILNDSALFDVVVKSVIDSVGDKFSWGGQAASVEKGYVINFKEALLLNGVNWKIDSDNSVLFTGQDLLIDNLNIYKPGQEILITTIDKDKDDNISPLEIGFRQFRLAEISNLMERNQESFYDGKLNGNVLVRNLTSDLSFLADMVIEELILNEQLVGTAIVSAEQKEAQRIDIDVDLFGKNNNLHVEGSYIIDQASLDMIADVDQLELRLIDPFLETLIHESKGSLSGSLDITGLAISPDIEGNVSFVDASTVIDFLNIRYAIPKHQLNIRNKKVEFGTLSLVDPSGNIAIVTGAMTYNRLDDIRFDLALETDRFQIINTTVADNELFYGKIFMIGSGTVKGNAEKPIVNVNAKTVSGTEFVVQPLTYEESLAKEDFIIFANPDDYQKDTSFTLNDLYKLSEVGVDLTGNIGITPEAQLEIVLDPTTGDKLVCRGQADLVVQMSPLGDLSILGNYTLTSGQYNLVFQGVLKKTFDIEPGSTVTFIGDPLKSKFKIDAVYKVRASPAALIQNQTTKLNANASRKIDVEVTMSMTGNLEKPLIVLDIIIPNNDVGNSDIGNAVSTSLAAIRQNESDLNKQVFGLLLLNSFISTNNGVTDGAVTNIGLSSVSSLLTNQLNLLAKKVFKGVDIDFGFDSYKSGIEDETITEFGVGIRKNLLNDRLSVKVGGNVNNSTSSTLSTENSDNSTFSGDFVLEYKLNEKGNYQLRFFQILSSEQNVLKPGTNNSETGISIFFTKSFNSRKYQLKLDEGKTQGNE